MLSMKRILRCSRCILYQSYLVSWVFCFSTLYFFVCLFVVVDFFCTKIDGHALFSHALISPTIFRTPAGTHWVHLVFFWGGGGWIGSRVRGMGVDLNFSRQQHFHFDSRGKKCFAVFRVAVPLFSLRPYKSYKS